MKTTSSKITIHILILILAIALALLFSAVPVF